jgi:hypothetical protein
MAEPKSKVTPLTWVKSPRKRVDKEAVYCGGIILYARILKITKFLIFPKNRKIKNQKINAP